MDQSLRIHERDVQMVSLTACNKADEKTGRNKGGEKLVEIVKDT